MNRYSHMPTCGDALTNRYSAICLGKTPPHDGMKCTVTLNQGITFKGVANHDTPFKGVANYDAPFAKSTLLSKEQKPKSAAVQNLKSQLFFAGIDRAYNSFFTRSQRHDII